MTLNSDPKFKEKLTFCLKNDVRNLMNFNLSSEKSRNLHLMGYFCQKYVTFELKDRVVSRKMTYGFKNSIRNLVNFHTIT